MWFDSSAADRTSNASPRPCFKRNDITNDGDIFSALKAHGYLKRRYEDDEDYIWWETTTAGNALAMTSFGKPITRKTADRLVTELVTRARDYNADADKPLFMDKLRVFGSYMDPDIDPLGDVDIELSHGWRSTDPQPLIDYTKAGGKHFSDYMDELFWPEKELIQRLRNRSAALNITTEDINLLTATSAVIYTIDEDDTAIGPPQDRRLVGRN